MLGHVLFIKKNQKELFGAIQCDDGTVCDFGFNGIQKGNYLRVNAKVEFDVTITPDGKKWALNICLVNADNEYPVLDGEKVILALELINGIIDDRGFIDCAVIPDLLNRVDIDYKQFAKDLKSFLEKYFSSFTVKKNFVVGDKEYPMVLVNRNVPKNEISSDIINHVIDDIQLTIEKQGFLKAEEIPGILKKSGIESYRDYSPNMDMFIDTYFSGIIVGKRRVMINGKQYPKIYVPVEKAELFIESSIGLPSFPQLDSNRVFRAKERITHEINEHGYIKGGDLPSILRECGIDNYKDYAKNIEDFIRKYFFDDFEMKKNEFINGKKEPSIIVVKEPYFSKSLKSMFNEADYSGFLKSDLFKSSEPSDLGADGIEMALKALAGYLGDNIDNYSLNAFQRILIETPVVADLKQYKDNLEIIELGAQSSYIPVDLTNYTRVFANVHNGKQTLNNNWNGIIERFWAAKNSLAIYLTALGIIKSQKDSWIDLYIDESFKECRIEKLPVLLKVYCDFVLNGKKALSVRLKKKIIGHCFDCNDTITLIKAYDYFGNYSLPEFSEVIEYLKGQKKINSEDLIYWFHSGIGERIAEKITNYYWYNDSNNGVDNELLKVFSFVLWEYRSDYFTAIVFDPAYATFDRNQKEKIMIDNFINICQEAKAYKKAFVLVSYVYFSLISSLQNDDFDYAWYELRNLVKAQTQNQLTEDVKSARAISLFKYDSETLHELETYYCNQYVSGIITTLDSEEQLDDFINKCEELQLSFITQWVIKYRNDIMLDAEQQFRSILSSNQFAEAIIFAQGEKSFTSQKKIALIKEALCQNFRTYMLEDKAYELFDSAVPVVFAERILLERIKFSESYTIMALICLYVYMGEWLKALYLFEPFKNVHRDNNRVFIDKFNLVFSSSRVIPNTDKDRLESHLDIVRVALKVYDLNEFDSFVSWAHNIQIPTNTRTYSPEPMIFDKEIQTLIKENDFDKPWQQLVLTALRTDNNEKQDSLRFSIIASYIGRKGLREFETLVRRLSQKNNKKNNKTKGYVDYYISLWKGLLNGKYSANFLGLNRHLINEAPLTFWNVFYDISVCKNHVFSSTDFEYIKLNGLNHNIQLFYEDLLNRYSVTRETVFINISLSILRDYNDLSQPMFEQYIPFCSSSQSKELLLSTLLKLIHQGRFLEEIISLLSSDCWKCESSEYELLSVAKAISLKDYSYFIDNESFFTEDETNDICSDVIECIVDYPDVKMKRNVFERIKDYSLAYQYRLMQIVVEVQSKKVSKAFLHRVTGNTPIIDNSTDDELALEYYTNLMVALYKRQLEEGSDDLGRIRNRYYRILAANILSCPDRKNYSDDDIIALMHRNHHFTSIYPEYKQFKFALMRFVLLDSLAESHTKVFLLGFISNNWRQFVQNISYYSCESLEIIRTIESYTNYRDLNILFLKEYIYDGVPDDTSKIRFVEKCSPLIAVVMKTIHNIYQEDINTYEQCKTLLVGICYLDNSNRPQLAFENMQAYLRQNLIELKEHWEMYMSALLATSYVKTIINILAQRVREKRREKRIDINTLKLWQPVFAYMNETAIYYYLLSARYAMDKRLDESKDSYALIPSFDNLPEEWNAEKNDLQSYVSGKTNFFYPSFGLSIDSFSIENEATNVSFIKKYRMKQENSVTEKEIELKQAVNAYKTILSNDAEDSLKYNSYIQLFLFVNSPENLYDVYRKIEGKKQGYKKERKTFNELVIEYGSLVISFENNLSHDAKLEILIEIFEVFSFLNDVNQGKKSVINRLLSAEQSVLETPGVTFEMWIEKQREIEEIIKHNVVGCSKAEVENILIPIKECTKIYYYSNTEMELLSALENWRSERILSTNISNYENAFIRAVDEKVLSLRSGVNLSIKINNDILEDESVFYQIVNVSPTNSVSVMLSNTYEKAAHLEVYIAINNGSLEKFSNSHFSCELNLRPQDSCGQSYKLPKHITCKIKQGDYVTVILCIVYNGKIICNSPESNREFIVGSHEKTLAPEALNHRAHYGTAIPAFSKYIKGFGREDKKAELRDLVNNGNNNLAIIYGPSRVGKSSLLNYLANDYFVEYCDVSGCTSIMKIRVADEQFSKNDYNVNMLTDRDKVLFENASQYLEYLFCTPLLIAFSEENTIRKMQMCKTSISDFPVSAKKEIMGVLRQNGSVLGKFNAISQILTNYNCQIWLMYDEFQQVVESWRGSANELAELCAFIKYNQDSIKLIICGSDELVRIFECIHDENWDEFKIKTEDTWVFVGQLNDSDFGLMMNDRSIWTNLPNSMPWNLEIKEEENSTLILSPVLQSLYDYTGGNAICGKIFGEELLDKIKSGLFINRTFFYPSDITKIAYELLNSKTSKLKNLLITHTTKNLQNELPYLIFIARELSSNNNKSDVSLRKILEFFSSKESEEVETALKVLLARGILKTKIESHRYGFATLFYFDFFKDLATDSEIEKLRSEEKRANTDAEKSSWVNQVIEIIEKQSVVDKHDIGKIIDSRKDNNLKDEIGEMYGKGDTINAETYIGHNSGTSIGRQNNIALSIQNMSNAFNTLLNGDVSSEAYLKAFSELPKLRDFVSEDNSALLVQRIDEYHNAATEEEQRIVEAKIEELTTPAEQSMAGASIAAAMETTDFFVLSDDRWEELVHISKEKLELALPKEFISSLSFAVMLHNVFEEIISKASTNKVSQEKAEKELDYCPVAIMYCKIVEAMLKELHTEIYINRIGEATLKGKDSRKFKDLIDVNGVIDKSDKDLSIGSFAYSIVYTKKENTVDDPDSFYCSAKKNEISEITGNSNNRDVINKKWRAHAKDLAVVQGMRNKSAHEASPITRENFDWLIETLFDNGELMRIAELARWRYPN